ncbi:MAG: nitrous oxide reductase accessory protein NosL [Nitrospiraceae bacterium]|nr:nitrous oxide reductase accessory protein NosL [Nitrospiraceae bacterium]
MKTVKALAGIVMGTIIFAFLYASVHAETTACRTCEGVTAGSPREVRIEYRDGTVRAVCGLRCAGAALAAYRDKRVEKIRVREHGTGNLLDAAKAVWVIDTGTGAFEPFSGRQEAEAFSAARGGRVVNYADMMAAVFSSMGDRVRDMKPRIGVVTGDDIARHPDCLYCGMDRKKFAFSRVLLKYSDGTEVGLCSLHCAGLDLALHPEKQPGQIFAGAYDTGKLLDAEKAVWVLGGSKYGVMSLRGKWAFETRDAAAAFMRDFGGVPSDFGAVMRAAYEDMWEIIR